MSARVVFKVSGISCAMCGQRIEKGLRRLEGIINPVVNVAGETVSLEYNPARLSLHAIYQAVESLGYRVVETAQGSATPETLVLKRLLIAAALLSAPMLLMMLLSEGIGVYAWLLDLSYRHGNFLDPLLLNSAVLHDWRLQLALATPVQFLIGYRFYKNAYYALKSGSANMDLLVVCGTSAAYLYSLYHSFYTDADLQGMKPVYFESSMMIITLILLGKYLEALAKGKTSDAIRALLKLKPQTARVIREGLETDISLEEVQVGDLMIVRPGEQIPLDGTVLDGNSTVDESMLSGESMPVEKQAGAPVTGGSLNQFGALRVRVAQVGGATVLGKIIQLVEQAQGSKAPIQRIADRVCGFFVPVVIALAAVTFGIWYFGVLGRADLTRPLLNAIAVLVVSCPCALGLATPTAMMVGMGKAAQNGILFKNSTDLETACRIRTVVLDKTGTITSGEPRVEKVVAGGAGVPIGEAGLLRVAAVLESKSEHPLGVAIYEYYQRTVGAPLPEPEQFVAVPGRGVAAKVDGVAALAGTEQFLESHRIDVGAVRADLTELRSAGKIPILLAIDQQLAGMIVLADPVKEHAAEGIAALRQMGVAVAMLTGDHPQTAQTVAAQVGITRVFAGVLPDQKAQAVCDLKRGGTIVAMVGDGINDAPALAVADVGVAIGKGTDVAIETGTIVLLRDDLRLLAATIRLSQRTMTKIKQNLFWAFIYNLIAIPIAAGGGLRPELSAVAMAGSSVSVLLNSLSLKRFKVNLAVSSGRPKRNGFFTGKGGYLT